MLTSTDELFQLETASGGLLGPGHVTLRPATPRHAPPRPALRLGKAGGSNTQDALHEGAAGDADKSSIKSGAAWAQVADGASSLPRTPAPQPTPAQQPHPNRDPPVAALHPAPPLNSSLLLSIITKVRCHNFGLVP